MPDKPCAHPASTVEDALLRIEGSSAVVASATLDPEITPAALDGARIVLGDAGTLVATLRDALDAAGVLHHPLTHVIRNW